MSEARARTDHTPTTEDVKEFYGEMRYRLGGADWEDFEAEFDRWLTEVQEAAWDEGQKSGLRYADRAIKAHDIGRPDLPGPPSPNPYRTERTP